MPRLPLLSVVVVLASCVSGGTSPDAGTPEPLFAHSTLDEAHAIGVVELGHGTDCSVLTWCASSSSFERITITAVDTWVGRLDVERLLLPQQVMETLDKLFGPSSRAVYAGRVEGPDDPALYDVTCGMDPPEPFTWPTDAHALWVMDADGSTLFDLQCVLSVAGTLDAFGRDADGHTAQEAMRALPGCTGTVDQARADARASQDRVPGREAQVTGENRCRHHDVDAGI